MEELEEGEIVEKSPPMMVRRKRQHTPIPRTIPNEMGLDSLEPAPKRTRGWDMYANTRTTGMLSFESLARVDPPFPFDFGKKKVAEQPVVAPFTRSARCANKDRAGKGGALQVPAAPPPPPPPPPPAAPAKKSSHKGGKVGAVKGPQPTIIHNRSLDDLFRRYPDKKLQTSLDPRALNTAREVVIQMVNEATIEWLAKWCPGLRLDKINSIHSQGDSFAIENYSLPPEALDLAHMRNTLADMFRKCHDMHPKAAGDITISTLLDLMDLCLNFMGVLRDHRRQQNLRETTSIFQGIPVCLNAKKTLVVYEATRKLRKLNAIRRPKKRTEKELMIVEDGVAEMKSQAESFEITMLTQLMELLAKTKSPASSSKATGQ
ncbi:hypothetical protein GGS20DRAFT_297801 [Poronia punctata]|nr:hypothetical protein GGS20DRAFT_297801 [Poronia punctata]